MTPRELDAALWSGPWFSHKVVAMDWPCYRDPEDGSLTAICCPADSEHAPLREPVFADSDGWLTTAEDGMQFADVEVVPELSTTWEGFGLLVEEAQRRGWDVFVFWTGFCEIGNRDGRISATHPDLRMAFALACAKACGIDVDNLVKEEKTDAQR